MRYIYIIILLIVTFLLGAKVGKETTTPIVAAPVVAPIKELVAMDVISKRRFDAVVEFCYDGVKYIKMGDSISVKLKYSSTSSRIVDLCGENK